MILSVVRGFYIRADHAVGKFMNRRRFYCLFEQWMNSNQKI